VRGTVPFKFENIGSRLRGSLTLLKNGGRRRKLKVLTAMFSLGSLRLLRRS